ncbi:MAG: biotin transporter BioY [Oscillospiraceae bacterium]
METKFKTKTRTLDLLYIALMAVLMSVCAWISLKVLMVEFTLQLFAVFCALSLLGGKRGTAAIVVYIALGAVGVPVFAGFNGGLGALLSNTGGYIVGFLFIGLIYWLMTSLLGDKLWVEVSAMLIGLVVCYAFGTAWFMFVYARSSGAIGLATALGWCVFPFIPFDLAKMALALLLSNRLRKFLN